MKKEDLRIVYMGTPDFAVEALRQLVEGGYNVVGVITMPDKPDADIRFNILPLNNMRSNRICRYSNRRS